MSGLFCLPGMGMRRRHIYSYTGFYMLQEGLQQRDFTVRRLNTYNTVPVESLAPTDVASAREASVAAFASPSAVKSWLALVGGQDTANVAIACIGDLPMNLTTELTRHESMCRLRDRHAVHQRIYEACRREPEPCIGIDPTNICFVACIAMHLLCLHLAKQ